MSFTRLGAVQVCTPCLESCPTPGCSMPCGAACNHLPQKPERCAHLLKCGHQCPCLAGEACCEARYCQQCCKPSIKEQVGMASLWCICSAQVVPLRAECDAKPTSEVLQNLLLSAICLPIVTLCHCFISILACRLLLRRIPVIVKADWCSAFSRLACKIKHTSPALSKVLMGIHGAATNSTGTPSVSNSLQHALCEHFDSASTPHGVACSCL